MRRHFQKHRLVYSLAAGCAFLGLSAFTWALREPFDPAMVTDCHLRDGAQ